MKKRILIILAVFAITFGFNLMSVSAATKDNCSSTGIRCQGIKIGKGEFSGRSSNEVYVSKGGRIDIGIYTDEDSLFQMGVYLDDENLNLHGSSIATGKIGSALLWRVANILFDEDHVVTYETKVSTFVQ